MSEPEYDYPVLGPPLGREPRRGLRCRLGHHDYQPVWRILEARLTGATVVELGDQVYPVITVEHAVLDAQCSRCHAWRP